MNPLVTVAIPCFNAEKYINKAISSIINQTYKNLEIIVVDDASDDSTYDILNKWKECDERIKLIHHEKNMGVVASLNEMIKLAQGKYIARMDADDISSVVRIALQVECMEKNPEICLCGSCIDLIDDNDSIIGYRDVPAKHDNIMNLMPFKNEIIHPTVLIRLSTIRGQLYDEQFPYVEDYELWCRLIYLEKCKFYNLNKRLVKYRIHNSQICQKNIDGVVAGSMKVIEKYNLVSAENRRNHEDIFFRVSSDYNSSSLEYIRKSYEVFVANGNSAVDVMVTLLAYLKKNSVLQFVKFAFTPLGGLAIISRLGLTIFDRE